MKVLSQYRESDRPRKLKPSCPNLFGQVIKSAWDVLVPDDEVTHPRVRVSPGHGIRSQAEVRLLGSELTPIAGHFDTGSRGIADCD